MLFWPEQMAIVPAEFVGKARALRSRLLAIDLATGPAIDMITKPVVERWRRHPVPRAETLAGLARIWPLHIPSFGLLDRAIDLDKRSLRILELRAGANNFHFAGWRDDAKEPGVSLTAICLEIAPHRFRFDMLTIASVSLHCLSRRYQRGMAITDADVFADLRSLAQAHGKLDRAQPGEDFTVQVADGKWVGSCTMITGNGPVLMARTFLDAEAVAA
jgi:hypothetical protein